MLRAEAYNSYLSQHSISILCETLSKLLNLSFKPPSVKWVSSVVYFLVFLDHTLFYDWECLVYYLGIQCLLQ